MCQMTSDNLAIYYYQRRELVQLAVTSLNPCGCGVVFVFFNYPMVASKLATVCLFFWYLDLLHHGLDSAVVRLSLFAQHQIMPASHSLPVVPSKDF